MEEQSTRRGKIKGVYEWAESVAFAVIAVVLVFTFVFRIVGVEGKSMEPTLEGDNFVMISDLFYTPKSGDIVVITPTVNLSIPIIKRVIATQGQVVDINVETGAVTVDGLVLDEPYIAEPIRTSHDIKFPQTVPQGCIFVLGDNRNQSLDSRDSSIGMVDTRYVLGRTLLRLLPLREFGPVR